MCNCCSVDFDATVAVAERSSFLAFPNAHANFERLQQCLRRTLSFLFFSSSSSSSTRPARIILTNALIQQCIASFAALEGTKKSRQRSGLCCRLFAFCFETVKCETVCCSLPSSPQRLSSSLNPHEEILSKLRNRL